MKPQTEAALLVIANELEKIMLQSKLSMKTPEELTSEFLAKKDIQNDFIGQLMVELSMPITVKMMNNVAGKYINICLEVATCIKDIVKFENMNGS
jgi:hypothetical protein